MRPGPNPSSPGKHRGSPTPTLNRTVSRSWSARGGAGRSRMSSRVIESIGTGCDGWVSWRRRLGWVGSWANADVTRAATEISVAILVTVFVAFKKCSSFPDVEVYSGGPAPSSIPMGDAASGVTRPRSRRGSGKRRRSSGRAAERSIGGPEVPGTRPPLRLSPT